MSNKNITILLPIHKIGEEESIMLSNALESIEDFHNDIYLTIICPTDVKNKLDNFEFNCAANKIEMPPSNGIESPPPFLVHMALPACV